jgi:hypothetical protein
MAMKKFPETIEALLPCELCNRATDHSFSHYAGMASEPNGTNGHSGKVTSIVLPKALIYSCAVCGTERMWGNAEIRDSEMLFGVGGGRARN